MQSDHGLCYWKALMEAHLRCPVINSLPLAFTPGLISVHQKGSGTCRTPVPSLWRPTQVTMEVGRLVVGTSRFTVI